MRNWVDFVKTYALVLDPGVDMLYRNGLIADDKTQEITSSHSRLSYRGIKTPTGIPPIDEAAQAAWDRAKRAGGKVYPRSSVTEVARRATQISAGQLTGSNGLVWPGQLASRMWKKGLGTGLFLRKPYNL